MKKLFLLFAVAGTLVACDNASTNETKTDSTTINTNTTTPTTTTVDTSAKLHTDSTTHKMDSSKVH